MNTRDEWNTLTIQALVNRIKLDQKFLVSHPENKDWILKRIKRNTKYLVQLCLKNDGDHSLEESLDCSGFENLDMSGLEFLETETSKTTN